MGLDTRVATATFRGVKQKKGLRATLTKMSCRFLLVLCAKWLMCISLVGRIWTICQFVVKISQITLLVHISCRHICSYMCKHCNLKLYKKDWFTFKKSVLWFLTDIYNKAPTPVAQHFNQMNHHNGKHDISVPAICSFFWWRTVEVLEQRFPFLIFKQYFLMNRM